MEYSPAVTGLFLICRSLWDFVDTLYVSWRLPPKAAISTWLRVVVGYDRQKETAALKIKAAVNVKWRVKTSLLCDGFFSFAVVRQVSRLLNLIRTGVGIQLRLTPQ